MIQADIASIAPDDLREYPLGSVLAGGNAAPGGNVRATPADWLALTDAFARAARHGGSGKHAPIPLLFGIDAVHGHSRIPGATIFPHNVGLGAAHDPELITRIGQATAAEMAVTGIDWAFAPTIAVVRDPRWGRAYESYSEEPARVAAYAAAMVSGLQGGVGTADFMSPGHAVASVKHFLGDGGTIGGRDQFDNTSTEAELIRVHAAGYPPAIAAGVLTVMASYNSWQGVKMHANHALLTDVLKDRFGFNGFVIGDWNAQEEIPGCTKYDCPAVILAGVDMIMAPDSWKEIYRSTLSHVRSGEIPQARVDDAVRRILRVKALSGLFERAPPSRRPGAGRFDRLGSAAHRAIAREAVRKSLVLLKNDGGVLPLNPKSRILVAGAAADDIGRQSGGWTIDWQGAHNTNADFPGATSIRAGLESAVAAAGGAVEWSVDGRFAQKPDAAIVVFGERPYAEFYGDRETLQFSPGDDRDLELMRRLKSAGIPVVAIFISGRPMWVNPELNAADAFVAAWLPGSEGGGLADVLLRTAGGGIHFDFTGTLSFSWPESVMPVTFDATDEPRWALFPRGFGLSYAHPATLGRVPESPRTAPDRQGPDVLFTAGRVIAPWSLYVSDGLAQVRVTTARQASPSNALTVTLASDQADAVWSGNGNGELQIGGPPVDLLAAAKQGLVLQLRYRVAQRPAGTVLLGVRCEAPYAAALPVDPAFASLTPENWTNCKAGAAPLFDVTPQFTAARPGEWASLAIPLACFAAAGADLSDVRAPIALVTGGSFAVSIADVRFAPPVRPLSAPDSAAPRCPRSP